MVFMVFHGFSPKCTCQNCILAPRSSLGPPPVGLIGRSDDDGDDFPCFLKFEYWRQDGDEEAINAGLAAVDERSLKQQHNLWAEQVN